MSHRVILPLAAGALLAVGCGPKETEIARNPPPLEPERPPEAPPVAVPDAAVKPININPPPPGPPLPTWDQVASGHPEGATNPPIPVLNVTPTGVCYKAWMSPFSARERPIVDSVRTDCDESIDACGTQIVCPPQAAQLLADWNAKQPPK